MNWDSQHRETNYSPPKRLPNRTLRLIRDYFKWVVMRRIK